MPQGDKSSYTDKQKRQAAHIEAGYEKKGVGTKTAEMRAWATVNKLTGTSTTSIEDAVDKAIKRAHKTIKNLCWFQGVETRGNIEKGRVHHWQVTIKVGFTVND